MKRTIFSKKFWLVIGLSLILITQSTDAFARGRKAESPRHRENIVVGHQRYHYRDGRFYKPGLFGLFEIAVSIPPMGAIISFLPEGHRTMIVRHNTYYYYENIYYTACPNGYVVVTPTAAVVTVPVPTQVQVSGSETIIINVPNTNGSFTPVKLTKCNDGYIGPQGEYYPGHPTLVQLKVLYGS